MSVTPIDPEVRSRVLADLRARRGCFKHGVLIARELISSYGRDVMGIMAANAILREVALREVRAHRKGGGQTYLFVVDARFLHVAPKAVLEEFRRARNLPTAGTGR